MESIWQKESKKPEFSALSGDIKTDALIIGGGMAGILCGYRLRQAGVDCVIAEARTICDGITKNTTAKVTCHHGAVFDTMLRRFGVERAGLYLRANQKAVEDFRELSQTVDCDFEEAVSYVYSRFDREKIEKEVSALNKLGCSAQFTKQTELPFPVAGAVRMDGQAQFHPLKFAYALAKELNIYENTKITGLTSDGAISKHGRIRAKKIIVTTHFPFLNRHGMYFLKMYQHRSYVLALKNAPRLAGMYVDASDKGLSFRSYKNMLLLGGGGHRTGKRGGGWRELSATASEYYPASEELCRFAAQDCMTLDDIAYIGSYSPSTPDVYVATGFHKWGMTSSMAAANILADLVCDRKNEYASVFSPARSIFRKQLWINAGESVLGLLTPTVPRCSHLGCALKYNRQEHSWDCSCHGSRFTEDGRVIDNPAKKEISIQNRPTEP